MPLVTMPDVIADDWLADTQVSYDTVAASYAVQGRAALAAEPEHSFSPAARRVVPPMSLTGKLRAGRR
jgi:hypothetical protein